MASRMPNKLAADLVPKLGLAALVLLAPGGFVLGAGLAVRWWRRRGTPDAEG